jgi:hypothetical protein
MRTLLTHRFEVDLIKRVSPACALINIHRADELSALVNYTILFSIEEPSESTLGLLETTAKAKPSRSIVLSDVKPEGQFTWYPPEKFYAILGGPVTSGIILAPDLPMLLDTLGKNSLPADIDGKPDDIFEEYVKESLQFLVNAPAWRYGQERRFEKLPDGLIFGRDGFLLLFDAKAYADGFPVGADDIRRFASYVRDFATKYEDALGRVHCFLVVSASFDQGPKALLDKSNEMYAACQTKLSFIEAKTLGNVVELVRENISFRNSMDWRRVFSNEVVNVASVEVQLRSLIKDNLL